MAFLYIDGLNGVAWPDGDGVGGVVRLRLDVRWDIGGCYIFSRHYDMIQIIL